VEGGAKREGREDDAVLRCGGEATEGLDLFVAARLRVRGATTLTGGVPEGGSEQMRLPSWRGGWDYAFLTRTRSIARAYRLVFILRALALWRNRIVVKE
jgi:hypothetical protein